MNEIQRRERRMVVAEALTWKGTPYHLNARVKGVGVDCGTFLIAAFAGAGLIEEVDLGTFARDFHLHRGDEVYEAWLRKYCREVTGEGDPLPGDIILYRFGRIRSHGALVVQWPTLVHAYYDIGVIEADARETPLADRQEAVYSFWG